MRFVGGKKWKIPKWNKTHPKRIKWSFPLGKWGREKQSPIKWSIFWMEKLWNEINN